METEDHVRRQFDERLALFDDLVEQFRALSAEQPPPPDRDERRRHLLHKLEELNAEMDRLLGIP